MSPANLLNIKYSRPSLFAVLVFVILTIRGPENRVKQPTPREFHKYKPKTWVLVFVRGSKAGMSNSKHGAGRTMSS